MFFTHGAGQATFEVDAWSRGSGRHPEHRRVDNPRTIQRESTALSLVNGRPYTILLRVRRDRVLAYLDNRLTLDLRRETARICVCWMSGTSTTTTPSASARTTPRATSTPFAFGGTIRS